MQPHHQRGVDGGGEPIAAPHQKGGHLPQPDAGLTAREACATLHDDDDCGDGNDENKELFSCSCPSAPLSSACSISSVSGLSNSVLSHSLAGQTMTPLSMEGSESCEPAVRRLGGPPTPFDAMAGLDELVTSPPRNALDETEQSPEGASNRPPTPPQPPPLSLDGSTSEREQLRQIPPNLEEEYINTHTQHDPQLSARSPQSGHNICREAVGDTDATRSPECGDGAFPRGTDAMFDAACTNGHARKCDDAGHAPQQPADATLVEHGEQCSAHMSAGCQRPDQGHQLQGVDQRECRPTERAAAEPSIPDANARPSGLAGAPTSGPDPLNPSDSSAPRRLCAPEHDSHRANRTIDSYAPKLAARDQKFQNTKPGSQNSSQTGTAPRDPPFASGSSPPSCLPPSSSRLSRSTSVPKSTVQIVQGDVPLFKPLVRTASDNSSLRMRHPRPDINTRTGALRGNIVQLEATAERLSSTTTSTEVAIRDLHAELKRSDSQRSAAALARAGIQSPEREVDDSNRLRRPALTRNYSASSSLTTRSAHSTTASRYRRARSGSLNAAMQSSSDTGQYMSRTGPGKGSVRSVRTGKQSLAEISESEPMSLTRAAFDEADQSNTIEDDDDTIRPQTGNDKTPKRGSFVPNTDAFHAMIDPAAQAPNPSYEYYHPEQRQTHRLSPQEQRPTTSASYASTTHNSAFRDFDGIHCDPDLDLAPPPPQSQPMPSQQPAPPHTAGTASAHPPRPTSYLDHETGQEMLYYPARVPAMLSLPPKLSRKPKAAARNQRQSQVLSAMPEASRKSGAAWLPDPLADNPDNSFLKPISLDMDGSFETPTGQPGTEHDGPTTTVPEEAALPSPSHGAPEIQVTSTPGNAAVDDDEVKPAVARPLKEAVSDVDIRKSRLSKYDSNLPPQLRASVFFDMPSTTTNLEVKDGSAMATLDHLLDASTHAPVSAFTDHMIAGKLGQEVYGAEKRQSAMPKPQPQPDPSTEPEPKKRVSMFHRFTKSKDLDRNKGKETEHADPANDEALPPGAVGYATLSPDSDEFEDKDKSNDGNGSDEDNEEYHGPPTTLLAELQIRKQQQKNRTRPLNQPSGMHSTLLELDAVAEAQRKTRKGRKVNLAWEDPDPIAADAGSDDEDVPLGLLHAAKAAGTNDFVAATAELNRPLGLMERREMEENEPLAQRRARLQGVDQGHRGRSLVLNPATRMSANRLSAMPSLANLPIHTRAPSFGGAEQEEEEGETLGERMRRLKREEEESLPKAWPVSGAFSSELLSQFGDLEDKKKEEEKEDEVVKDEGEEETLGERRKRLQAEREAGGLRPVAHQQSASYSSSHGKRLSMAGILAAHPKRGTAHLQPEAERNKAVFGNGRFNDGTGGAGKRVSSRGMDVDWNKSNVSLGNGMIQQAGVNSMNSGAYNAVAGHAAGYNGGGAPQYRGPAQGWYPQQAPMGMPQPQMQGHVPMGMQVPMGPPMAMGMGVPPNQGQSDPIEQWRRSVMP